uniref:Usherin n=1 Tax=Saccoglossus kowalevskii TaxID=10224 RepID=A0ABM0LZJ7_SACKO|nr:PREDICTED: usherin [Saccoglossus kowalevskii]
MVSTTTINFDYRTASGLKTLTVARGLSLSTWQNLAIQIYDAKISVFINGLESDGSPYDTQTLMGPIVDSNSATIRVGQRLNGASQYIGRMQEFQFYSLTLTNREIHFIATGTWLSVHVQSECRCPDSHPRVNPTDSRFCIKNDEPDTTSNAEWRVNQFAHPLTFANDGDLSSYWISAFLDDITIVIDLNNGQYQVFYVVLQFYSPQPTALTIQRKKSDALSWEDWQYLAQDCLSQFGLPNDGPLLQSTSVNCLQFTGYIPYSKGNITFQLLAPEPVARPGYNDFYNTPELLEFVKATQIRLRLQGHYYVTNPRHNYFGIEEITVSARCNCHGHGSTCDMSTNPYQCDCLADSYTEGTMCERCKPLYNDKPFRYGDQVNAYNCKPCECYGHATSCSYIESEDPFPNDHNRGGGGVCTNCQHNTAGNRCDQCKTNYYRELGKSLDAIDVCSACSCNIAGVVDGGDCAKVGGQCNCKLYVTGRQCDTCKTGYYNLQSSNVNGCSSCVCSPAGSIGSGSCQQNTGDCVCKTNVIGINCNQCNYGYKNLDINNPLGCDPCNCDPFGSTSQYCDPVSGQCQCQLTTMGLQCNSCKDNYYGLDSGGCKPCDCDPSGSLPGITCDQVTGQCVCKANVQGTKCNECKDDYHSLLSSNGDGCMPCGCNTDGTLAGSTVCDKSTAQCPCKPLVQGMTCNQCQGNSWGLSVSNPDGCQACNCDASGTLFGDQVSPTDLVCDQNSGQCACLTGREGRQCNSCSSGYYLPDNNGRGCLLCACHPIATLPGTTCSSTGGQCVCKGNGAGVSGRQCNTCLTGYYNFNDATGTCTSCNCNIAGSVGTGCDVNSGVCQCKQYVMGVKCDTCIPGSSNLDAGNPYGCTKSPSQQPAPTWEALSPYSIKLTWEPPDEPNGAIQSYSLFRDDVLLFQGITNSDPLVTQEYIDTQNIQPYTEYIYYIVTANTAGSTQSPSVTARTPDNIPNGFDILIVSNIQARSADFTWSRPNDVNGPILSYTLSSVSLSEPDFPVEYYNGLNTYVQVSTLIPFTNYTFTLTVCIDSGCGTGVPVIVITPQAAPQMQLPPIATPLSSTEIFVLWQPPMAPNGVITHYELFMRGALGPDGTRDPEESRIFFPAGWYNPRPTLSPLDDPVDPPATQYTVEDLSPYTQYEFKVASRNSVGSTESAWSIATTLEAAPLSMPTPVILTVSSSTLSVTWQKPSNDQSQGLITVYNVYWMMSNTDPFGPPMIPQLLYSATGDEFSYLAGGFEPFSTQTFYIESCNSVGCVSSSTASGQTLPAAPSNQNSPSVEGYNSTTMYISWIPPSLLNGPAPSYQLQRTMASFSIPPPRVTEGRRFPGGGYYFFPSGTIPSSSYTGIELDFRTQRPSPASAPLDALLLFAVSDGQQEEYIVIQLRSGRPWFLMDPQGGAVAITTFNDAGKMYDDGEWHHILVLRNGNFGSITVDEQYTGAGTSSTSSQVIGETIGVYMGGLPNEFVIIRSDSGNTEVVRQGFVGCMRNVRIKKQHTPTEVWEDLDWNTAVSSSHVFPTMEGCPAQLQPGIQFLGRGYAVLSSTYFTGGFSFSISFDFRTEINSGLLITATGTNGAYILIQLIDGNLQFQIYTDIGVSASVALMDSSNSLCNGQWQSVTFSKTTTQLSITVLNVASETNQVTTDNLQISSSLNIGGVSDQSDTGRILSNAGITVQSGYGGCLKNLRINSGTAIDFMKDVTEIVNVNLDGCPPTVSSQSTCTDPQITTIYQGVTNSYYDTGLQVYTEYIYRVISSNDQGSATSEWSSGRTLEGAPTGISAPNDPISPDGYTIEVRWQQSGGNTGLITQYILSAYNLDSASEDPITAVYTDTTQLEYVGNITGVIPYTNYRVTVTACTAGGCTESDSVFIQTSEEEPEGVNPPVATEKMSTSLKLSWSEPYRPNGIITGYALYMENSVIYSGNLMTYTQTGLSTFTSYQFKLTACTVVGCTDSDVVSISTGQLPPSSIDAPTIYVEGPRTIEVEWNPPNQMNGILENYVLYVSIDASEFGDVVYNSTATVITSYTLNDLMPGTTYFIRIAACNGGGCITSSASIATTHEDPPQGVPAPSVIALSPYSLYVSWTQPDQPNGVITSYSLYQNGIVIQTGLLTTYTVLGLTPWSLHTFRVEACTTSGCTVGSATEARTQESPPVGDITFQVNVIDAYSVSAYWTSPSQPNGRIIYEAMFTGIFYVSPDTGDYTIEQDTRILYNGTEAETDIVITGVVPFTNYNAQVKASNTMGMLMSNVQSFNMPAAAPDGVLPPNLTPLSPTSIQVTWQAPARNNAPGQSVYQVVYRPAQQPQLEQNLFSFPISSTSYTLTGLTSFIEYEFKLIASNSIGSTHSEWVSTVTNEDSPGPIDPPMATILGPTSMIVSWEEPAEPNGEIIEVKLYQNDLLRITLPGDTVSYTLDDLVANTAYYFKVEVCNSAGCTASDNSLTYTTNAAAPSGIAAPTLFSETPTSILISWSPPQYPNGVLQSYELERRLQGSNTITTVIIVDASAQLAYVDQSSIAPFTTYEYRVIVKNSAGSTSSEWSQITTKQAQPSGLATPIVEILSSTSIRVAWQPPAQPNGEIVSYTVKMPNPRILIENVTVTEIIVEDLVPYTQYTVTVQACTGGGCTESNSVVITTDSDLPEGLDEPVATAITQNYIAVVWTPPNRPNGDNIRYELSRMKIRQPLSTDPILGLGFWELVYSGTQTSFQDLGLPLFTTYQYRVTVYNTVGQLTSDPSDEVTTLAGQPTASGTLSATTIDHTSVFLEWTTPSLTELQGNVVEYIISYSKTPGVILYATYPAGVESATLVGLTPNTLYEFKQIIDNGAYNITSPSAFARTLFGAPEGFSPPNVYAINSTAFRVSWQPPESPNGDILNYTVYVDDVIIDTVDSVITSYVVTNLQPYTVYDVKVEVCTSFGCYMSDVTKATTQEASPNGVDPPNLRVLGSISIAVDWLPPSQSNGVLQGYDIYRRTLVACNTEPQTPDISDSNSCSYVQCRITESLCGTTCYSGNKACCNSNIYEYRSNYECCNDNYIPMRNSGSDICCGGQFHSFQAGYQCCNGQYLAVLPGQICCIDTNENRAIVGYGDACCGGIPYTSDGPQICCRGMFYDGYNSQCCGDSVVSDTMVCCEDTVSGSAYAPDNTKQCCGTGYVEQSTTLCCEDETGNSQAHSYSSLTEKLASNEKCCGLEKISVTQQCCNNAGYNPSEEVCADKGTLGAQECGTGVVCPIMYATSSYCDMCDFDRNNYICGSVSGYYEQVLPIDPGIGGNDLCATTAQLVYSADINTFTYIDDGLSAFTTYEYAIMATNTIGSVTSEYSRATTEESTPDGVLPPQWSVRPGQLDTIYLSWVAPSSPNGQITSYMLIRDNIEVYRGMDMSYTDTSAIQPYEDYQYVLRVCTYQGCTDSQPVTAATLEAPPADVFAPGLNAISSTSIVITWQIPGQPNGVITQYQIYREGYTAPIYLSDTSSFSYTYTGLDAYTEYSFSVTACTVIGCTSSDTASVTTLQAPPQGVEPPTHVVVSATTLEIYWYEPTKPNGEIINYRLFRDGVDIYNGLNLMYSDVGLSPNTRYLYAIEASTIAGTTKSVDYIVTTPSSTPMGIPIPRVTVDSSTQITAQWDPPVYPYGQIIQYGVMIWSGRPDQFIKYAGLNLQVTVDGLLPYTQYDVRVQVCLVSGCGVGATVIVQTLESPPLQQLPPTVKALGSALMELTWDPPVHPNGDITKYYILRRLYGTGQELLINIVDGDVLSFLDASPNLEAFTMYEYKIRAENSQGSVDSGWAQGKTLESPPSGMGPPNLQALSSFSILATWSEPLFPNGVIVAYSIEYQRIIYDPTLESPIIRVATVDGETLEAPFYGLVPFTKYKVRIVAMNSAGEGSGTWAEVTTLEGVPSGIQSFIVEQMTDGRSVLLKWNEPTSPNGDITEYKIYEVDTAGQMVSIYVGLNQEYLFRRLEPFTDYTLVLEACTNMGCSRGEQQVITTAEVPPANQPAPTLGFTNATAVELQWKPPIDPNGAIIRYDIVRRSVAIQLRKKRAIDDPVYTDSRVVYSEFDTESEDYSYLDSNLQPYTHYEYKIRAVNSKGFTDSDWVVMETGQAPPSGVDPPRVEYVTNYPTKLKVSWSAPAQSNGILQPYLIQRNTSTPFSFPTDAPKEFIDTNLQAYTVYMYTVTACNSGGCTTSNPTIVTTLESSPGVVSPPELTPYSSTAIQVKWTKPPISFGEISRYEIEVDGELRYTGLSLQTLIMELTPYQEYEFVLVACTSGGCSRSEPVFGRPLEAPPENMEAPLLLVISARAIEITWSEPLNPNGEINLYELRRDSQLIYQGQGIRYQDFGENGRGLTPGREYAYVVTAFNNEGSAVSPPARASTDQSSPDGVQLDSVVAESSESIRASWSQPLFPNGEIIEYNLYVDQELVFSALEYSKVVYGLAPYTEYEFRLQACTELGCAFSDREMVYTLQDEPTDQGSPLLSPLDNGVHVKWYLPQQPNGVILGYELKRRHYETYTGHTNGLVSVVNTTDLEYNDMDPSLQPSYEYEYQVISYNSIGRAPSSWSRIKMPDAPPEGMLPPIISDIHAYQLTLTIQEPLESNGIIIGYTINRMNCFELLGRESCPTVSQPVDVVCVEGDFEVYYTDIDLVMEFNATSLQPYTEYDWKVIVYNVAGFAESSITTGQTYARLPDYVRQPSIVSNSSIIIVDWSQSFRLNGKLVEYTLTENAAKVYSGHATKVDRPNSQSAYEFVVSVRTTHGEASSPLILYEPSTFGGGSGGDGGTYEAQSDVLWYQSVWFIALIVLLVLLLLFVIIAVFLHKSGPKQPYERQRPPLPPRQKRGNYLFNACGYAPSESVMDPIPQAPSHVTSHPSVTHISHKSAGPNNVYIPTVLTMPVHGSTMHLIDDKASLKYKEEEDGIWDHHIPLTENGIASLAYEMDDDDDTMTHESRPYSITKEQTMFTDTHL